MNSYEYSVSFPDILAGDINWGLTALFSKAGKVLTLLMVPILLSHRCLSQEALTSQLQILADNDAFWLNNDDGYYSSGIFASLQKVSRKASLKWNKKIKTYRLSHFIYSPSNVRWRRVDQLDRPYAGMINAGYGLKWVSKDHVLESIVDIGWLGPGTRTDRIQWTYHTWFGMKLPRGWQYQIEDTPALIWRIKEKRTWRLFDFVELVSVSELTSGTIFNHLRQTGMLRLGQFKPLGNSSLGDNRIDQNTFAEKGLHERFMTIGLGGTYKAYDATIEGNWIGEQSPFTLPPRRLVLHYFCGFYFSWSRFDIENKFLFKTKENEKAKSHRYIRIRLNYRY